MSYFIFCGVRELKKIDFDYLNQQLKELESEVERLKRENPDDDYTELDETVERFRKMISERNVKEYRKSMFVRNLISNVLSFIFHLIVTISILGFCFGLLKEESKNYIGLVIFVLTIVVFNYRKLSKALVFNGPLKNHKLTYTILLYFLFSCVIGILDFYLTHVWTSIWECILTLIILGVVLDIGEFIYYRKLVLKYKKGGNHD